MIKFIKDRKILWICIVAINLVLLKDLLIFNRIYIIGDEFGYWANASLFAGCDWKEVAKVNPYYSYGYSLLLAPLFMLKDSALMYKAAIVMNAVFLSLAAVFAYSIVHQLHKNFSAKTAAIMSMAVVLYPNNIFSASTTQCETLLILLYTIVFWCIYKYTVESKVKYLWAGLFTSCFMYMVHMRSLGVLIGTAICVVLSLAEKKEWKFVIGTILLVVLFVCLYNDIKELIVDVLYLNNTTTAVNDYSGQVNKVAAILSLKGIKNLLISVLGKFFYLGLSTCFLFYWMLIALIKKAAEFVVKIGHRENIEFRDYMISLFMILTIGSTFCITAIASLEPYRIDALFYGRYNEMIIIPVLIVGMIEMYQTSDRIKYMIPMIVGQFLLAIITYRVLEINETTNVYGNNMCVLAALAKKANGEYIYPYFTVNATIKVTVVAIVCVMLLSCYKNYKKAVMIGTMLTAVFWCYHGVLWQESAVMRFQRKTADVALTEMVQSRNSTEIQGYYSSNCDNIVKLSFDFLQYILPEYNVKLDSCDNIEEIEKNMDFVIQSNDQFLYNKIRKSKDYEILECSDNFYLIHKK